MVFNAPRNLGRNVLFKSVQSDFELSFSVVLQDEHMRVQRLLQKFGNFLISLEVVANGVIKSQVFTVV